MVRSECLFIRLQYQTLSADRQSQRMPEKPLSVIGGSLNAIGQLPRLSSMRRESLTSPSTSYSNSRVRASESMIDEFKPIRRWPSITQTLVGPLCPGLTYRVRPSEERDPSRTWTSERPCSHEHVAASVVTFGATNLSQAPVSVLDDGDTSDDDRRPSSSASRYQSQRNYLPPGSARVGGKDVGQPTP